jgi:predicted metal-dependent enzyme (double-stranded beta helix superfamily)
MTVPILETRPGLARLRDFVGAFAARRGGATRARAELLRELVAHDDWLPEEFAQPDPERYRQYLLHCDSAERFSVVSFVWGPGQRTPIHDHRVWGLVGVLRGAEIVQPYAPAIDGSLHPRGAPHRLEPGEVDIFGPAIGDIHSVANAYDDRVSISIHVYGANIGAVERATYDEAGRPKRFVSGYANHHLPNMWDRSRP